MVQRGAYTGVHYPPWYTGKLREAIYHPIHTPREAQGGYIPLSTHTGRHIPGFKPLRTLRYTLV